MTPSRRHVLGVALGLAAVASPGLTRAVGTASGGAATLRVRRPALPSPISPFVYGGNEIGTMDGGAPSGVLDRRAGVTARRLGGNLMTTYNWVTNACNAGKDDRDANGDDLADALGLPADLRREPGAVIAAMHATSLAMGAASLVTLPLAGYVAADRAGPVGAAEAAPSRRFVPVRWSGTAGAGDPIDPGVADIPQLLRRLTHRFGTAADATGIRGYALDNEPGLWSRTHPRVVTAPVRIGTLIERSVEAATVIKAIDPAAWVVGPASWGATGMASLQDAPDWPEYRHFGSFLGAYLDAFQRASARAGHRLLDALDVHWYPFSTAGDLFRTEGAALAPALLQAPRSLDEPGFREESWVSRALPVSLEGGLALPLLPSLERLVARFFPGTRIAVTEFNYGGAGQLASGLALADALGRLGRPSTLLAAHWGSLDGWLGQAYRLYRDYDGRGGCFGAEGLDVEGTDPAAISAHAALGPEGAGRLHVVVVNKDEMARSVDIARDPSLPGSRVADYGFDADHPATGPITPGRACRGRVERVVLPPRSARHYVFEG